MNALTFASGWYCEAQPNGAYAVVIRDSHIETSRGPVSLSPGGNLLQMRLAADGIRFAGTGHNDGIAWEWNGSGWINHGPTFGNSACIYDATDQLVVVSANVEPTWAQGWAFVDDNHQLVPGWVAYAAKDGLSAWTKHGPIAIGQGHDGGGVITAFGLHQIATGQATWVRFNQAGDQIALAWIQEDHNEARLLWLTVAELLDLRAVGLPEPPVIIDHGGEVLPTPTEPKHMDAFALPRAQYDIVVALYNRHQDLANSQDDNDRRKLAKMIAQTWRARFGDRWGWKSNHGNTENDAPSKDACGHIPDGSVYEPGHRQDIHIWDLFDGTSRRPNPHPIMSETVNTAQYFVPVEPFDHLADAPSQTPDPEPPVEQPPVDVPPVGNTDVFGNILAELRKLNAHLGVR